MFQVHNLSKSFGGIQALKSVSLDLAPGEIHGLIGANGCGKTTLLNILFGHPLISATGGYSGDVLADGVPAHIRSPAAALRCGIGMIHQEFALVPGMTVAENIKLNRERTHRLTDRLLGRSFSLVDRRANRQDADRALAALGMELSADARVADLALGARQFVEIAREIDRQQLRLLMLDEPTAVLSHADAVHLMGILRRLAAGGTAILYVSHRLDEVLGLCDRATVLRDGEVAGRWTRPDFDLKAMVEQMTGRRLQKTQRGAAQPTGQVLCRIDDLHVEKPGERLRGVSLAIRRGEILGLAGLSGHGKLALGPGIMGMHPTTGRIFLDGDEIRRPQPSFMLRNGVCLLPEERAATGLLLDHSIADNIVFTAMQVGDRFLRSRRLQSLSLLDARAAERYAKDCVERFGIKCRSVRQKVAELSGGNQQKVCIARALAIRPQLILVAEPTRGVDIAAKEIILGVFVELNRDQGTTFVIASSELDELRRICDRIAVIRRGRLAGILQPDCAEQDFALAFAGEARPAQ